MDDLQYDEFGNYIGNDLSDSSDSENVSISDQRPFAPSEADSDEHRGGKMDVDAPHSTSVVLYEDRKLYPTMEEVYGPDVEVLIQEEDTVPTSEPIIAPARKNRFDLLESQVPETSFSHEFLAALMTKPDLIRNIAVIGNLHHGKTSLIDMLVKDTHTFKRTSTNPDQEDKPLRFTDNRADEQARRISIKAKPVSLVVPSTTGKHFLLNVMDTPGHNNFSDEVCAALRLADGVVVVVDAVEGPLAAGCEQALRFAVREGLSVVLVINKIDRLCVELRLPVEDAYMKLQHSLVMVNQIIQSEVQDRALTPRAPLSPAAGNVLFASTSMGFIFSLESFARQMSRDHMAREDAAAAAAASKKKEEGKKGFTSAAAERRRLFMQAHADVFGVSSSTPAPTSSATPEHPASRFDPSQFARCLWGDVYFNPADRTFTKDRRAAQAAAEKHAKKIRASARRAADDDSDDGEDEDMGSTPSVQRSFVHFVLEPLWKLISHSLALEENDLKDLLEDALSLRLPRSAFEGNLKRLLRNVLSRFFAPSASHFMGGDGARGAVASPIGALVDACVMHLPSPLSFAPIRSERDFTGSLTSPMGAALRKMLQSPSGATRAEKDEPLCVVHVVKHFHSVDGQDLEPFGLVLSGTLRKGDSLRVLGENFAPHAGESDDAQVREVTRIAVLQGGRYRVEVSHAGAGCWVLLGGLSGAVRKSATLVDLKSTSGPMPICPLNQLSVMRPLQFLTRPVFKLSVEPLRPAELPRMIEGLRMMERSYLQSRVKVEESGEHVIYGLGELAMDCMMHDLREVYAQKVEVKVSDPTVLLQETVTDVSAVIAFAETANHQGRLKVVAHPLNEDLSMAIEKGLLPRPASDEDLGEPSSFSASGIEDAEWRQKKWDLNLDLTDILKEDYRVDSFAAARIWAFGPEPVAYPLKAPGAGPWDEVGADGAFSVGGAYTGGAQGGLLFAGASSALFDESIPGLSNRQLLSKLRPYVTHGFQWATKEGPLIEETIRQTAFRVVDAEDKMDPLAVGALSGGRWVPTARRAIYASTLLAAPRIMEPMLRGQVICSQEAVARVYQVLQRRRGHVLSDKELPGSPLFILAVQLPALDSFGFETDVRTATAGQAFVETWFDSWAVVDSDPLDASIVLRPLEASNPMQLGRELLLKTRRRKGLREQIAATSVFDAALLEHIAEEDRRVQAAALRNGVTGNRRGAKEVQPLLGFS